MSKTGNPRFLPANVFLTGLMGSGKSAVGPLLAGRMEFSFVDTDTLVEKTAKMSIPDIFHRQGEERFRALETRVIKKVTKGRGRVVALGGGALLRAENLKRVLRSGVLVYLRAQPATLARRLKKDGRRRPLLQGFVGPALTRRLAALLSERRRFYQRADIIVGTEAATVSRLAVIIFRKLES